MPETADGRLACIRHRRSVDAPHRASETCHAPSRPRLPARPRAGAGLRRRGCPRIHRRGPAGPACSTASRPSPETGAPQVWTATPCRTCACAPRSPPTGRRRGRDHGAGHAARNADRVRARRRGCRAHPLLRQRPPPAHAGEGARMRHAGVRLRRRRQLRPGEGRAHARCPLHLRRRGRAAHALGISGRAESRPCTPPTSTSSAWAN